MMKLASKITGCIIWSSHYPQDRKVVVYVNHDQGQKLEYEFKPSLQDFNKPLKIENCFQYFPMLDI